MKKSILSALFVGLLLLAACKKHSTFSGRVLSSDGMVPIEGAKVDMSFYDDVSPGITGAGGVSQVTDSTGEYLLEYRGKNSSFGAIWVKKEGYAEKDPVYFDPGDCEELDLILNPYDAWLSVTFENTTAAPTKYYYNYSGPFLKEKYCYGNCGPFNLGVGEAVNHVILIPGGADINVRWDTTRAGYQPYRNQTTVPCPRHDTTHVHIKI